MHLISFDASSRQLNKLKKGQPVRIKKGSGFNLVVNPSTYNLVSRAFSKNKGLELKLSPEELDVNESLSPDQHELLGENMDNNLYDYIPYAEGGSIFKKVNKALHSKTAKKIGRELKPLSRELKNIGRQLAHEQIADLHMAGADNYGDNEHAARLMNLTADMAHHKVGGKITLKNVGRRVNKALHSKTARAIGRELQPFARALKGTAKDILQEQIANAHMAGQDQYGDDPHMSGLMNVLANIGHERVAGMGLGAGYGAGLGAGLGAGVNAHQALKLANLATANANYQLAKMHNNAVHGQLTQPPVKRYWNDSLSPPSRGTGITNHYNMIRGRGSMLSADDVLPPALQSQPYGANWQMQFFLPPQYSKYNDGTDIEGRGLYL